MFVSLLLGFILTWSLWSCVSLYKNYRIAKGIGLPIVIEPVSSLNLQWLALNQFLFTKPALSKIRNLIIHKLMRFSYQGWSFDQGYEIHAKISPIFTLVTPGSLIVHVADAEVAHNIFTKRKDFIKPDRIYKLQNAFGPHVNSAEGKTWQRHRRLTAPSFNERVSSSVWQESIQQAQDMLQLWKSSAAVATTVLDTATVALNVLTGCGFGVMHKFGEDPLTTKVDGHFSYRDAVMIVVKRFPILLLLPEKYISLPFMPTAIKTLGKACKEFRAHVNSMLVKERESKHESNPNLLTSLIHASEAEKANKESIGLTDEELLGNMFVFTVAGHETTANTIATAIVYLARHPKYQVWLREELRHILQDQEDIHSAYSTSFPRLKRHLAIMLETLRIHGSILNIPKATSDQPQTVMLKGSTSIIPPDTFVFVNNHAIQLDPSIWGSDAKEWKPERWITQTHGLGIHPDSPFDSEDIYQPQPGSFAPWSEGPRICLGKRFSQVEFVAILAVLLRENEVVPVLQGSEEDTNTQLDEMLRDCAVLPVTLQMKQPEKVKFLWRDVAGQSVGKP